MLAPPCPPSANRFVIRYPRVAGLPRDAELVVVRSDAFDPSTFAALKIGGRKISAVGATQYALILDQKPYVVHFGRDAFLVFGTSSATTYCKEFVLIDAKRTTLRHVGAFQTGWAPRFSRTGVVYEYPRFESREESHRVGHEVCLQKAWRWETIGQKFVLVSRRDLRNMPPVPRWRFTH